MIVVSNEAIRHDTSDLKTYIANFYKMEINIYDSKFNKESSQIFMKYLIEYHKNFKYKSKLKKKVPKPLTLEENQIKEQKRKKKEQADRNLLKGSDDETDEGTTDEQEEFGLTKENPIILDIQIYVSSLITPNLDHFKNLFSFEKLFKYNDNFYNIEIEWIDSIDKLNSNLKMPIFLFESEPQFKNIDNIVEWINEEDNIEIKNELDQFSPGGTSKKKIKNNKILSNKNKNKNYRKKKHYCNKLKSCAFIIRNVNYDRKTKTNRNSR